LYVLAHSRHWLRQAYKQMDCGSQSSLEVAMNAGHCIISCVGIGLNVKQAIHWTWLLASIIGWPAQIEAGYATRLLSYTTYNTFTLGSSNNQTVMC
jgi:hypothetical protein